jgi:nucleotide-binding universal stress UspA family protein
MAVDGGLPPHREPARELTEQSPVRAADPHSRIRRILLATDLAPASGDAATWALDLAAAHGAQLLIVSVIDPDELVSDGTGAPSASAVRWDQIRDDRQEAARRLVARSRSAGVEAAFMVWTGHPGESIVAAASAESADIIVVGSHGRSRIGRMVAGSVSDHVVRHAPCPVLVVRASGAAT